MKQNNKKLVLCSILPIFYFTKLVGADCDIIEVELLLSPQTGCPHNYSLTTRDFKKLASSNFLVINGAKLDDFIGNKARRVNPNLKIFSATERLPIIFDKNRNPNPHLWVNPKFASEMVLNIKNFLAQNFPHHLRILNFNAQKTKNRYLKLYEDFLKESRNFKKHRIVAVHGIMDYLARDLNLEIVALLHSESDMEPSAGEIKNLILTIKKMKGEVIFTEPQYPDKLARVISSETGIPVFKFDPVSTGNTDPLNYEKTMYKNLRTLKEALIK